MSKNYPTRMHEVLGVEPWERFDVKWKDCTKTFRTDSFGNVQDMEFYDSSDDTCYPANGWDVSYMVNHPERITRRPKLSEEQVAQMQALETLPPLPPLHKGEELPHNRYYSGDGVASDRTEGGKR